MSAGDEPLPREFGPYLLTAFVGEDALGRVYRARRLSGEPSFARVRIFESPDISEDAVLDAIQENGEIHAFLKNPAIARGVTLDSVDGTPYLAWNEESGRTLDEVVRRARQQKQSIPYEHGLLIAEKIATALDHAYNTTLDGENTVHGLVWPGFVSVSDDGEIRLTGFGLATGFLPSLGRPRFAREIGPYVAPEEASEKRPGRNSDVYSVGVVLFELLAGRLPAAADPLADLKAVQRDGAPMDPEPVALLKMCLGPTASRFQSSGELRRELGKLLFSGAYSPSTFNLAFFLNGLFGADMEAETAARLREAALDVVSLPAVSVASAPRPRVPPAPPTAPPPGVLPTLARDRTPARGMPPPPPPSRRMPPVALGGALLVAAAVVGGGYVLLRRPSAAPPPLVVRASTPFPAAVAPPATPVATGPTNAMSESQFKEEVARRVSQELRRLEQDVRRAAPTAPPARGHGREAPPAAEIAPTAVAKPNPAAAAAVPEPSPAPPAESAPAASLHPAAEPTPVPPSPPTAEREAASAPAPASAPVEDEVPPKIARIVKPVYPSAALRARLRGTVILRVHVTETGRAGEIQVVKGAAGGLTESAVAAVRSWRFEPARRGGVAVASTLTIPIPFEP